MSASAPTPPPPPEGRPAMALSGYEAFHAGVRRLLARASGGRLGDRIAAYALSGADLVVLVRRLLADERLPAGTRKHIVAATVYLALPFDLVPETTFGPAGVVDDALVLARLLDTVLNEVDATLVRELWPGDRAVLERWRAIAGEGRRVFATGFRAGVRLLVRRGAGLLERRLGEAGRGARRLLAGDAGA